MLETLIYNSDENRNNISTTHTLDYNMIDASKLKRALGYYESMRERHDKYNHSMVSTFMNDVHYALKKIDLTEKQEERMVYFLKGYTLKEIAQINGNNVTAIQKSIDSAVFKLLKQLREKES